MKKKYTVTRARNTRAKTITFSPSQLTTLRELIEAEIEDSSSWPEDNPTAYVDELRQLETLVLPGVWIELYRAVEDDEGNFDETKNYQFSVREIRQFIEEELIEAWQAKSLKARKKDIPRLARKFKWEDIPKFLEFDSGRSHACGYWELRILGPEELEVAIQDGREPG